MSWPYTWLWYFPSIQAERVTPTQDFANCARLRSGPMIFLRIWEELAALYKQQVG